MEGKTLYLLTGLELADDACCIACYKWMQVHKKTKNQPVASQIRGSFERLPICRIFIAEVGAFCICLRQAAKVPLYDIALPIDKTSLRI